MKLIKLSIVFSPRLVLPPSANVQHDYPFYAIRDHLGNTRLTFTDKNGNGVVDVTNTASNEILQENHFYPFGLDMAGPWMNDAALDNQYKYNGKEYNGDFGLNWMDYGARWYDASVGRWWWVDPMVEKYSNYSPYNYTLNNPVRFIDPNGKQVGVDTVLGGGKDGRDLIRITVSGKLINMSSKKDMDMADFLNYLKEEIESIYKGENIDGYDYSMEFNFEVANNMDEVKDSDHLVVFADVTEPGGNEIFGSTNQLGGRVLFVSAARFEKKPWGAPDGSKTVAHELGHLLNLPHVTGGVFSGNYLNLMHEVPESYIDAKSVSADQFQAIAKSYHNGFLNNGANHDANGMPLVGSARGIIWSGDAISRRKKPKK